MPPPPPHRAGSSSTHHVSDVGPGLVQLGAGAVDELLGVLHARAGLVGLRPALVHRAADVLQAVPLGGQGAVDGGQPLQETLVHVWGERVGEGGEGERERERGRRRRGRERTLVNTLQTINGTPVVVEMVW